MKLDRRTHDPAALLDFYEAGLTALGAVCERPWHDRLQVLAEGRAAHVWPASGGAALHEGDLHFLAAESAGDRDAARDVFPGCPLTFRLAEALRPTTVPIERVFLASADRAAAAVPTGEVAEKLWRAQYRDTTRWRLAAPFTRDVHFSIVALVRCEIQAIDQQWALCRVAVDLATGESDESLAREFATGAVEPAPPAGLAWPQAQPAQWGVWLRDALAADLAPDLAVVRARQQARLRNEWQRVDDYFENYARELVGRGGRGPAKAKIAERLAAAKAEQARHRADQLARHEILVHGHLDALLLVAEPVWRASIDVVRAHRAEHVIARFIPRARRWSAGTAGKPAPAAE